MAKVKKYLSHSKIAQILYDYFESERESLCQWLIAHDYHCAVNMRALIDSGGTKLTINKMKDGSIYSATDGEFKVAVVFPEGVHIENSIKESITRSAWKKAMGD